ncbi:hypothetical protein QEZ40_001700 [Streptomyces katrae]|uniref:Uncharacterized protein n=1 Tax=Streptomyces katrae TaxID=68223 RepID=A0ABT7GTV2_9ACTN|nr:hypothetical protein [Streptomyces katrae]MDK9497052.1 hypothetical protein [Streptomyces katrae]
MEDENVIRVEVRGHETAAVAAAERIAELFLSSGAGRPQRTPGVETVVVVVHADVGRAPGEGGYAEPEEDGPEA